MRIQQIRNATLKVLYGGPTILVDPWLQDRGTGFSVTAARPEWAGLRSPLDSMPMTPAEVLDGVDFCLVTHVHPDHFTPEYLPRDLRIVVQDEEDLREVQSMGFEDVVAFEGDAMDIGDVTIHRVAAVHGDNEVVAARMGRVSGYALSGEEKSLYIAGDTVYCPAVERNIDQYRPDVIAINCCEAVTRHGRLIMDLADVEAVCRRAPWALVVATHLDSVAHARLTSDDVRDFVRSHNLKQVLVPRNGETIEA